MDIYEKFIQHHNHKDRVAALVEFGLKSLLMTNSEVFVQFTKDVAMQVISLEPENVEELLDQPFIKNEQLTILDLLNQVSKEISEKIVITKFIRWDTEIFLEYSNDDSEPPPKSSAMALRVVK